MMPPQPDLMAEEEEDPPPFTYDSLEPNNDQFRLLNLLPGKRGSKIVCTVSHYNLRGAPVFEALSYTWGDPISRAGRARFPNGGDFPKMISPSETSRIQVNGQRVQVGLNLEAALHAIRDESNSRLLWIDALCIDQSNKEERSQQILHMADIYRLASSVLIWLGPADSTTDLAFDTMEELCWLTKYYIWHYCSERLQMPITEINMKLVEDLIDTDMRNFTYLHPSLRHIMTQTAKRDLLKALSIIELDFTSGLGAVRTAEQALGRFTPFLACLNSQESRLGELPDFANRVEAVDKASHCRSYFERLWVLQEMRNSSHAVLLCGARQIDFSMAALLVAATQSPVLSDGTGRLLPNLDFPALDALDKAMLPWLIRYRERAYNQKTTLAHEIMDLGQCKVSEPRDVIYALLGLSLPIEVVPDYDKSVSVTYAEAVRAMISQQQDLVILCLKPTFILKTFPQRLDPMFRELFKKAGFDPMFEEAQHIEPTPSWVPVFSAHQLQSGHLVRSGDAEDQIFKAGGGFLAHDSPLFVQDHRVLRLDGCFLDNIADIQPRLLCSSALCFRELRKFAPSSDAQYPTGLSDIEVFWLTALMSLYDDNASRERSLATNRRALHNFTTDIAAILDGTSDEPTDRFKKRLDKTSGLKAFFRTSEKFMGQVMGNAKVGDRIFVAQGSPVPFILRPAECDLDDFDPSLARSHFYTFIGPAYVHGIMYGEAMPREGGACVGCKEDLTKIRYQCLKCPKYQVCQHCELNAAEVHPGHYLACLKEEVVYLI